MVLAPFIFFNSIFLQEEAKSKMKAIKKGGSAGAQQRREDHSKAAHNERLSLNWRAGRGPAHMNDHLPKKNQVSDVFLI